MVRSIKISAKRLVELRGPFLSQQAFAEKVGASKGSVASWEKGHEAGRINPIARKEFNQIAKAFGLTPEDLHLKIGARDKEAAELPGPPTKSSPPTMAYNPTPGQAVVVEDLDTVELVILTKRAVKVLLKRQKEHPTMMGAKDQLERMEGFFDALRDDLLRRRAKHA